MSGVPSVSSINGRLGAELYCEPSRRRMESGGLGEGLLGEVSDAV